MSDAESDESVRAEGAGPNPGDLARLSEKAGDWTSFAQAMAAAGGATAFGVTVREVGATIRTRMEQNGQNERARIDQEGQNYRAELARPEPPTAPPTDPPTPSQPPSE